MANQKKEGDTSSSDGASVMKAIVFYLTSTFPMKRKDYYRRLRICNFYFGSNNSNYIVRTVIDQIVHNQNQDGGYLQRMIEQHEVNVPAVLTSISSNVRESLKNVLSPGGVVSECGKKIALAVKICREGDGAVNDILDQVILDRGLTGENAGLIAQVCLSILRGTYYSSTKEERKYLRKLSRTYILLFMLKNEPRVVEYFRNMTSNFNLYVGTDLIVRALSEHMLSSDDQMTKIS